MVEAGKISYSVAGERLARHIDEGDTWKVYTGPFEITADTFVRARTFRTGDEAVPTLVSAGTEVSAISYGFFSKKPMKPAVSPTLSTKLAAEGGGTAASPSADREAAVPPISGLTYDYLEDRWFALWTHTDQLVAKATGTTDKLLDVSMRATDGPFGVRYRGYIDVPESGVYTFYGPDEFINNICAPGYDLRVFVDGEEWDLNQTWHGRGQWSVPLAKGLHAFRVTYADARAKDIENQRIDLAFDYPRPKTTWRGVAPVLEVSGPGMERQAVPGGWLKR